MKKTTKKRFNCHVGPWSNLKTSLTIKEKGLKTFSWI